MVVGVLRKPSDARLLKLGIRPLATTHHLMNKGYRKGRRVGVNFTTEPDHRLLVALSLKPGPHAPQPNYWADTLADPCVYCGCNGVPFRRGKGRRPKAPAGKQMTKEHVIPASDGGSSGYSNIVRACARCNQRRGNTPLLQFLLALRAASMESAQS